jgi:hypothetical protein
MLYIFFKEVWPYRTQIFYVRFEVPVKITVLRIVGTCCLVYSCSPDLQGRRVGDIYQYFGKHATSIHSVVVYIYICFREFTAPIFRTEDGNCMFLQNGAHLSLLVSPWM